MTLPHEITRQQPPLISVWLAPRQTIESILATRPRHLVLLLASLGAISGFAAEILGFGVTDQLLNWHVLLGLIIVGAVAGIVFLYPTALVFNWIGRLLGGRASTLDLRAMLAWSMVPGIFGFIVVLAILVALKFSGVSVSNGLSIALRVIVTLCGLWSLVILLLMLSRVLGFGFWRTIATYALGLILPLLIAFLIRTFLFQPFDIPSRSMFPTLLDGDHFFVSKYSYGYSHYSFPFSPPLFTGRIFGSEPARGDVVVFRLPKDDSTSYVKRVVGLPGDRIQMRQGLLHINDIPVTRERLADFVGDDPCGSAGAAKVKRWRETLPNGVSHETLDCVDNGFYDNTNVYTVPASHFFMLGDNRDNSTDSRVLSAVGYVPFENIIGRVGLIYFSSARGPAGAAPVVRSERAGLFVH
jgi:signal peptidase I